MTLTFVFMLGVCVGTLAGVFVVALLAANSQ